MNREVIYAALFSRVKACTWAALYEGGKTGFDQNQSSRKLAHWSDVPKELMPCIFQKQVKETVARTRNLPSKWTLSVELYIYVSTLAQQDSTVVPAQLLNPILDSVQAAIEANAAVDGSPIIDTLSKLVDECKISGEVLNFEGDLGDLGAVIIPVEIVVPF